MGFMSQYAILEKNSYCSQVKTLSASQSCENAVFKEFPVSKWKFVKTANTILRSLSPDAANTNGISQIQYKT